MRARALLNWLYARRNGGSFILRFDDTARERSRPEYVEAIEQDLAWLEITPDSVRRQSQRTAAYDAATETLEARGRRYSAYETAGEFDRRRRRQQALGRPPIYDRAALDLTAEDRAGLEASGRKPHGRFRLEPRTVRWRDDVRGESHVGCALLSDPVLRREDGTYLYTLPSVVDDLDFGVTHTIRGEDYLTNTRSGAGLSRARSTRSSRIRNSCGRPPRFCPMSLGTPRPGPPGPDGCGN